MRVALLCIIASAACAGPAALRTPIAITPTTVTGPLDSCPAPDRIRAAFLRDSLRRAAARGDSHEESTGYVTFIMNGVLVAANVHGPGAFQKSGIPPLDSLGVEDIRVYKAGTVPATYSVCPGVDAVVIVTKRPSRTPERR